MIAYTDSSIVLPQITRTSTLSVPWQAYESVCTSQILSVELRRTCYRMHLDHVMDDEALAAAITRIARFEAAIDLVEIDVAVLERAAQPMPTALKTLDALHVATAWLYRERISRDLVFLTADRQQAMAVRVLGLEVEFLPAP